MTIHNLPSTEEKKPNLPQTFNGEIYQNVGKYARGAVLFAFEKIGGPEALSKWAEDNQDDFYTKLFPKIIARESEVTHHKTVDQLMDVIDGEYEVEGEDVEDAELLPSMPAVAPVGVNWNVTDYDFDNDEIIVETVSEDAVIGGVDMVDFQDE